MVSDKSAILTEIPRSSLAQIVNVAEDDFMSPSKVAMNSNNSRTSFHVPKDLWLDLAPTGTPRSDTVWTDGFTGFKYSSFLMYVCEIILKKGVTEHTK